MTLIDVVADMIAKADAIGHDRVWLGSEKAFVFISWDPETMAKALAVLRDAGLLCDRTVGTIVGGRNVTLADPCPTADDGLHNVVTDGGTTACADCGAV